MTGGPETPRESDPGIELDPAAAPASPDGFRLGAEPPRVMRLSRKTLAGVGAVAGISIGGALLWALQPTTPKAPENLYASDSRNRSYAVTGAPSDYGSIPKLGPPLPGDLGRPIVAAQQDGEMVPVPPVAPAPPAAPDPAAEARERALRDREAAQASRLFLGGGSAADAPSLVLGAPNGDAPLADPDTSRSAARKAFLAGGEERPFESAHRVQAPSSGNILQAGSIIPAALITGIRSDLPGQVTAQVTENVYDSPSGRILLIPQGSRLVGDYDSEIDAGQNRVLLAWDRLILPGGRSIRLERAPGADVAGMAGLADRTDNHWGGMLRAALVSTLLGIGAEAGSSSDDSVVRAIREGAQDSVGQTGRQLVERELRIPPTLTIRPGFSLRVIVTRDLVIEPARGPQ